MKRARGWSVVLAAFLLAVSAMRAQAEVVAVADLKAAQQWVKRPPGRNGTTQDPTSRTPGVVLSRRIAPKRPRRQAAGDRRSRVPTRADCPCAEQTRRATGFARQDVLRRRRPRQQRANPARPGQRCLLRDGRRQGGRPIAGVARRNEGGAASGRSGRGDELRPGGGRRRRWNRLRPRRLGRSEGGAGRRQRTVAGRPARGERRTRLAVQFRLRRDAFEMAVAVLGSQGRNEGLGRRNARGARPPGPTRRPAWRFVARRWSTAISPSWNGRSASGTGATSIRRSSRTFAPWTFGSRSRKAASSCSTAAKEMTARPTVTSRTR